MWWHFVRLCWVHLQVELCVTQRDSLTLINHRSVDSFTCQFILVCGSPQLINLTSSIHGESNCKFTTSLPPNRMWTETAEVDNPLTLYFPPLNNYSWCFLLEIIGKWGKENVCSLAWSCMKCLFVGRNQTGISQEAATLLVSQSHCHFSGLRVGLILVFQVPGSAARTKGLFQQTFILQ